MTTDQIRARSFPVPGEPGVRIHAATGRRYYSAAYLDDGARDDRERSVVEVALELEARRQELVDLLSPRSEGGSLEVRVVAALAAVALAGALVYAFWPYIASAGVFYGAYRHLTRHTRRRRPRSSWSSLGRTAALMFAAWNSRWLKPKGPGVVDVPVRVSVPAAADGMARPNRKYAQAIERALPAGCTIEDGVGHRHPRVLRPDGEVLRYPSGAPVTIASTPSASGTIKAVTAIRRAIRAADGSGR